MKLNKGDLVRSMDDPECVREIVEVCKGYYLWEYTHCLGVFDSRNSTDPLFELRWEKVDDDKKELVIEEIRVIFIRHILNQLCKPNHEHYMKHIPTGETWCIIGIDSTRVCASGWPATIAKIEDMEMIQANVRPLNKEELKHRRKSFGTNWK